MKIIKEEVDRLEKNGITEKEIELARSYLTASTLMKFDRPESIASYFGGQVFDEEEVWFPEDYIRQVNKFNKEQLDELAKEIVDYSKVNISLMGEVPQKKLKAVEAIFKE